MEDKKIEGPTLYGHPTGLFTLFFAEMWERFSYYGMRALLIFYIIKGFLGLDDQSAYAIYGAYGALVYAAPYIGGMLADRLLGPRRGVILGGILMAAGHLLMSVEFDWAFYGALALLICGNGFFKPNISTIVGSLYPAGSGQRDAGFTIFYMGINLGAAMSPILCGYIGETYGWHYGFGLATIGMLVGLAVFAIPGRFSQITISAGALAVALSLPFLQDSWLQLGVRILIALALLIAGGSAFMALDRGGLSPEAGGPPDPEKLKKKVGGLPLGLWVYVGTFALVPVLGLIVKLATVTEAQLHVGETAIPIHRIVLVLLGGVAIVYLLVGAIRSAKVERQRMFVVLILMFFSMLFWAFFEQAGSSVNNFTDRNVDRVFEGQGVAAGQVGETLKLRVDLLRDEADGDAFLLSQEQLGRKNADPGMLDRIVAEVRKQEEARGKATPAEIEELTARVRAAGTLTMTGLTYLRTAASAEGATEADRFVEWKIDESNVGMGLSRSEIPASEFQAANPVFILIFGLVFSALWTFLGRRGWEPSTPFKFALGLLQLAMGFGVLWWGAQQSDALGMVGMSWLLLGYLLHTTGELCLSPVGLSMVTKLSPARLVSTVMGAWFLATAFSNDLASLIASQTGVGHGEGGLQFIPAPAETVHLYGDVFGTIGLTALVSAVICFAIAPLLTKWTHPDEATE
ncbi:MAG: peptide MFS transporter [Deltaproteobacteria bacterium]|nr:peptide MFS transporter [Deltaproteobacteria bacterium]